MIITTNIFTNIITTSTTIVIIVITLNSSLLIASRVTWGVARRSVAASL